MRSILKRGGRGDRPTPSAEGLEARRLLAAPYPLVQLPALTPTPGDLQRAAVNGEAYEVIGRLVRSDGSTDGTSTVAQVAGAMFNWNDTLYFTADLGSGHAMYKLEPGSGTPAEIRDSTGARLSARAGTFVPVGDRLYFGGSTGSVTSNVFVTDGTSQGTRMLRAGTPIGRAGNLLVFSDTPPGPGTVTSLWRTDGTTAGTVKIRDSFGTSPVPLGQDVGDAVLFLGPSAALWRSDGTAAGTTLVKQPVGPATEWRRVGDAAYFITAGSNNVGTLWKTDGTPAGTVQVGQAFIGMRLSPRTSPSMTSIGDTLYYVAPEAGRPAAQLFATEGPGTTRRVTNLGTGAGEGVVPALAAVGDKVLFAARVGSGNYSLWETTGAAGGEAQVERFVPSEGGSMEYGPLNLLAVGGSLFYTQRQYNGPNRWWRYGVSPAELDPDGVLVVSGTDPLEGVAGNDSIVVSAEGDAVTATVNGVARAFPLAAVRRITVNGLGGNDGVTADGVTSIPLTFNGGGGQDTLNVLGTAGDDVVTVTSSPNEGPGGSVHLSSVEGLAVDTLGGADRVTFANLRTQATLHIGDGDDAMVIDDGARAGTEDYVLTDTTVGRRAGAGPLVTLLGYEGAENVTLVAGSGPDVITVTPSAATAFTLDGGAPAAPAALRDRLSVNVQGAAGTRHEAGPGAAAGRWAFANRRTITYGGIEQTDDGVPLTADVVDVSPEPRKTAVGELRIVFSEPVTGFGREDLRLTRGANPADLLTAQQRLETIDGGRTWVLGNLAGLTGVDADYVLTLTAAGSGIVDAVGSPLAEDATEPFKVDNAAPTADFTDVAPDPRTTPVETLQLVFNEPVAGLDIGDVILTRDGGPNLLTAAQSLVRVNDTTYTLFNLAPLTRAAGAYVVRVSGSGATPVTDLAGNALLSDASDAWRTWSQVTGRHVFYNASLRDGRGGAADARDDDAIAPDKRVLLPGQAAGFANYTSYDRGVNGIMVDIAGLPRAPTAADFAFRAGNSSQPSGWAVAPAPSAIVVRPGAGVDGADRVTITWADYSIRNRWLQVRVLPTAASGLPAGGDVFYVGNLVGETGNFPRGVGARMDLGDFNATRNHVFMADLPLDYKWDHNRDGAVNPADVEIARRNLRAGSLTMFTAPSETAAAGSVRRGSTRAAPRGRGSLGAAFGSPAAAPASIAAVPNAGSDVKNFFAAGGTLYFTANDGVHGMELWKTDGTVAGTVMVADINPGPGGSNPQQFQDVGGVVVFTADDGAHGVEPWRSDGTAAGTYLLEDVNPGPETSYPWTHGSFDGSRRAIVIGGVMYFNASRADEGFELWRTDGTPYGTYLVRDIVRGPDGSFPEGMVELDGRLVFSAGGNSSSRAVWRSTGMAFGTTPVTDPMPGPPVYMTASGDNVYYQQYFAGGADGRLFRTDGTAAGTSVVKDLGGGLAGAPVDLNGTLLMVVRQSSGFGTNRLYRSDGTPEGTIPVTEESGPNVPDGPRAMTVMNGVAYFTARDAASGWQLWRSDGTAPGTHVLKVIEGTSPTGSFPDSLTVVEGVLYFTALEKGVGRQIWRSDGTETGTVRLTGVTGGVAERTTFEATFAKLGDAVYFGAWRDDVGWELWRVDASGAAALFKDINEVGRAP